MHSEDKVSCDKENSHHSCFGDGSEAVDEDVTGDIDGRT